MSAPVTRAELFGTFRSWLDGDKYTADRIAAVNALADRLGLAANDNDAAAPAQPAAGRPAFDEPTMIAELRHDEGERLKVYRCTAGKRTIGVGRNLDDVGILPHETAMLGITTASAIADGITETQSTFLLASDIGRVVKDLDKRLPWWRKLDPIRQRVMVNMAFNLGIGGLCGFHNTLSMIERGDYRNAAINMLASKWARQVGARAVRLSTMMRGGAA
ncbi:MAG TPA: glycoside hydrolase family protein [Allosphingosinicella sp.]|jgi:lysozyme